MATADRQNRREELEAEYRTWARICEDKHGMPWPVAEEALKDVSDQHLNMELKKLKTLGRTPHE